MKMTKQSKDLNRCWSAARVLVGALVLCAPVTSRAINSIAPAAQTLPAAKLSPGVADIVKLVDAKVDPEVIKTYIKSSPTAYNPSATKIIALKDRGVGPEILTTMLERGGEVRAQSMRAASAAPLLYPGAITPNYAPAQAYNYVAQPDYVNYAPSYPAYSDTYDYPAYSCGYSWPYCGSSFYCGLGGYPYGGYCGGGYCGYPYGWGGCGFYGGGYYGGGYYGRGYYGGRGYGGYYGFGARSAAFAGSRGGFRSFSMGGRAGGFARPAGGFRSGGGFGGRSAAGPVVTALAEAAKPSYFMPAPCGPTATLVRVGALAWVFTLCGCALLSEQIHAYLGSPRSPPTKAATVQILTAEPKRLHVVEQKDGHRPKSEPTDRIGLCAC